MRNPHTKIFLATLILLAGVSSISADWIIRDRDGTKLRLSDYSGRWVLVNFWATWCRPCLAEIPILSALQKRHSDLTVIGVVVMYRKQSEITDFAREHAIPYRIVAGDEGTASQFGGMDEMPTSFLYSPGGRLILRKTGVIDPEELEKLMLAGEQ